MERQRANSPMTNDHDRSVILFASGVNALTIVMIALACAELAKSNIAQANCLRHFGVRSQHGFKSSG